MPTEEQKKKEVHSNHFSRILTVLNPTEYLAIFGIIITLVFGAWASHLSNEQIDIGKEQVKLDSVEIRLQKEQNATSIDILHFNKLLDKTDAILIKDSSLVFLSERQIDTLVYLNKLLLRQIELISSLTEAKITCATGNLEPTHKQSHDTLFLYTRYANDGDKGAENINFKVYFIYVYYGYLFEYHNTVGGCVDGTLTGKYTATVTGGDNYITNFPFDSSNGLQYLLVLGSYNKNKKIKIVYIWNPRNMAWEGSMGDNSEILKFHYSKNKNKYF